MSGLVVMAGSWSSWLPGPACAEAAGYWCAELVHEATGCGVLRGPGASVEHWLVESGSGLGGVRPGISDLVFAC